MRCLSLGVAMTLGTATMPLADDVSERTVPRVTQTMRVLKPLDSGRKVGETIPSFYSRAVTGPLANKSVCYVCRNGGRPVVMVLLRRMDPELKPLLQNLSRLVDRNRAAGLRGFGVLLSADAFKATSKVQTFAFNHKVTMPLTVGGEGIGFAACQNVHPDAAVTVVLYRRTKVVDRFAFRAGELDKPQVKAVLNRVKKLIEHNQ